MPPQISMQDLEDEFNNGSLTPISLNDYHRDGTLVPNFSFNNGISTTGQISLQDFIGSASTARYEWAYGLDYLNPSVVSGGVKGLDTDGSGKWMAIGQNDISATDYLSVSNDNGVNWTEYSSTIASLTKFHIIKCDKNGSWLVFGKNAALENKVARSLDNGVTWHDVAAPIIPSHLSNAFGINEVDTDGNGTWVACGYEITIRSADNGTFWSTLSAGLGHASTTDFYSVSTNGAGVWMVVGEIGRASLSTNNGVSWGIMLQGLNSGSLVADIYAVATDRDGNWVAGMQSGYCSRSIDNGSTWLTLPQSLNNDALGSPNFGGSIETLTADKNGVFFAKFRKIRSLSISNDGGINWKQEHSYYIGSNNSVGITPILVTDNNGKWAVSNTYNSNPVSFGSPYPLFPLPTTLLSPVTDIYISANVTEYDMLNEFYQLYPNATILPSNTINFHIGPSVTVSAENSLFSAMTTNVWPVTPTLNIIMTVSSAIRGAGGEGEDGPLATALVDDINRGGVGLRVLTPVNIFRNGGVVFGGGGGGGGANGSSPYPEAGGGGGGGSPPGTAGTSAGGNFTNIQAQPGGLVNGGLGADQVFFDGFSSLSAQGGNGGNAGYPQGTSGGNGSVASGTNGTGGTGGLAIDNSSVFGPVSFTIT